MSGVGRVLIVAGVLVVVLGLVLVAVGKGILPRLPGDIAIERRNVRVYVPLGTMIVVSLVLTFVLNLFLRR